MQLNIIFSMFVSLADRAFNWLGTAIRQEDTHTGCGGEDCRCRGNRSQETQRHRGHCRRRRRRVSVIVKRLDDTQVASVDVGIGKARTAAIFRRPSRDFEDQIKNGRVASLVLPGATPLQGGLPLIYEGKTSAPSASAATRRRKTKTSPRPACWRSPQKLTWRKQRRPR